MHCANCVASIILLAIIAQAHVEELGTNPMGDMRNSKGNLAVKLCDELCERALKAPSLYDGDLDDTMLQKPGHLATPASRISARSPLVGRSRVVPYALTHGLSQQKVSPQPAKNEALSTALQAPSRTIAAQNDEPSRRQAVGGALWLASGLSFMADPAQAEITQEFKKDFKKKMYRVVYDRVEGDGVPKLGISPEEILRLVIHDALTYDPATQTGGFSGSIRFPEELSRPENAGLAPVVSKLEALQKELQEATGKQISFADTEALAGQVIIATSFKESLCSKEWTQPCDVVYLGFAVKPTALAWGRQDASGPDPEGRVPWVGSSVVDFKNAFKKLGIAVDQFSSLAPGLFGDESKGIEFLKQDKQCANILARFESSKSTLMRSGYESTVFDAYLKLVNQARFDPKPYGLTA